MAIAEHKAMAHISRVFNEITCKLPKPKVMLVVGDPSKKYVPHCTILHRCADDTGCCGSEHETCEAKRTASVELYFMVSTLKLYIIKIL